MVEPRFIPYRPPRVSTDEVATRARSFYEALDSRRSVRMFSPDPVPRSVIDDLVRTASTAPSGAHRQPWRFVVVGDPETKRLIREAAEAEEAENYGGRLPEDWLEALAPLGTDEHKPYLEIAPWIVVLFEERYGINPDGSQRKNFYVKESVGIAAGMFVAAVHMAGLATLPHTPSPMAFLSKTLQRPENERPFALFPVGYPAENCVVPDLVRKALDQVAVEFPIA
jgi:iodotyrosine deiodinase